MSAQIYVTEVAGVQPRLNGPRDDAEDHENVALIRRGKGAEIEEGRGPCRPAGWKRKPSVSASSAGCALGPQTHDRVAVPRHNPGRYQFKRYLNAGQLLDVARAELALEGTDGSPRPVARRRERACRQPVELNRLALPHAGHAGSRLPAHLVLA